VSVTFPGKAQNTGAGPWKREGGGGGGGCHPDPLIKGVGHGLPKKFFRPFGPQFSLKMGPFPWICY